MLAPRIPYSQPLTDTDRLTTVSMPRLTIPKTPKCYVGSAFIRSESKGAYEISASDVAFAFRVELAAFTDLARTHGGVGSERF